MEYYITTTILVNHRNEKMITDSLFTNYKVEHMIGTRLLNAELLIDALKLLKELDMDLIKVLRRKVVNKQRAKARKLK